MTGKTVDGWSAVLLAALLGLSLGFSLQAAPLQTAAADGTDDAATQAKAVLQRVTGQALPQVQLHINPTKGPEQFAVTSVAGQLQITASSAVAAVYGASQYLQREGQLSVSWEGKRVAIPERFAAGVPLSGQALFALRAYMNVCTFGYSTPFWDWPRWQQEIDWMALRGINQPLAMEGQEYVWQLLWREQGLTEAELADFFSAPTVAPWQRMGNIENHLGPLPQSWIIKKKQLQRQILQRMRALGMQPVLPAFSGYVPKALLAKFPNAKIVKMSGWSGFARETYWLDPADPLFNQLASRFLQLYRDTYHNGAQQGEGEFYLADAFNEMLPPLQTDASGNISDANRNAQLAAYGAAIYQSIAHVHPKATWVLQGWMFGDHAKFWQPSAIQAFLSQVPPAKTLVHDIGNDRFDVWRNAGAYAGANWVYGFIHNYGGSNPIYGDFNFYQQQVSQLLADPARGQLVGLGAFPEGIENNSVIYQYIYDQAWQLNSAVAAEVKPTPDVAMAAKKTAAKATSPVLVGQWQQQYLQARYGKTTPELLQSWQLLEQALYQTKYWESRWWEGSAGAYLLFKRPTLTMAEFAGHPGDQAKLRQAIDLLLQLAPQYADAPLFSHDLLEYLRHYLTIEIDVLLQQSLRAYLQPVGLAAGATAQMAPREAAQQWLSGVSTLVRQLDHVLAAQPYSLGQWLASAAAYGENSAESALYVKSAKTLLTVWGGPSLKDYASRGWSGMYQEFYLPRWQLAFQLLHQQQPGQMLSSSELERQLVAFEQQWTERAALYPVQPPAAPLTLIKPMLQQLDALNKAANTAALPKRKIATHAGARP